MVWGLRGLELLCQYYELGIEGSKIWSINVPCLMLQTGGRFVRLPCVGSYCNVFSEVSALRGHSKALRVVMLKRSPCASVALTAIEE